VEGNGVLTCGAQGKIGIKMFAVQRGKEKGEKSGHEIVLVKSYETRRKNQKG